MVFADSQPGPSTTPYKFPNNHPQQLHGQQPPQYLPVLDVPHDPNYRRPAPISLTSDLISRFGLFDAFQRQVIGHNKYQHLSSHSQPAGSVAPVSNAGPVSASNSGVGKQQAIPPTQATDDAVGAAKREKKREKDLYKTLFKDLPGKHDTKRDRYLSELLMQPPKEGKIMPLDDMMAEMAFTIFDLPQASTEEEENKKRKKKRKREQEQGAPSVAPTPAHLPTPGGPPPLKHPAIIKQEVDPSMSQRPSKRPRQDTYPMPTQQPTPG